MMFAVLDTNVLVSALWSKGRNSPPVKILRALACDEFRPIVNDAILDEYKSVLKRSKFGFDSDDVDALIAHIGDKAAWVSPEDSSIPFPDPSDKVFFCSALAVEGGKVVTGNMKHFPSDPIVVTPAEFCALLGI